MRLLRNPEWKRFLLLTAAGILAAAAGALWWGPWCSVYVFLVCLAFLLAFWSLTRKRYERLEDLSARVEEVLYGRDELNFAPDEEGELAVLADRIHKMTVRLREQAGQLREDKIYLQDSLADISHQLKTPLTAIRLVQKKLRNSRLTSEERRELLAEMERLLTRMERLVEILLKTARLESGTVEWKKERILVRDLMKKALEPLEIPLELKKIQVETDLPEAVCFEGDWFWSVEAVENLLKNCMEHTPEGGRICIGAVENPVYTELSLRDTGPGFAEEEIPRLFERFYRGEGAAPSGTGIGLALAAEVVRQQNGTIRAGNHPEGGAEFLIRFYKWQI